MASPSSEKETAPYPNSTTGGRDLLSGEDTSSDSRRLTRSAGTVSAGVMTSRVLGLVREQVLAYLFPAKLGLDAFYAAFRIPNLLRDMFGEGALSKAFVSTFSEILEKEGDEEAFRLANLVLSALVLVVGTLTVLGIVYAEAIIDLLLPGEGFDLPMPADQAQYGFETKRELTGLLTRVMFPFIVLVSVAALVMGILNAKGRFLIPALASAFFNLGSIVIGLLGYVLAPRFGQHPTVGMAVGVLAGGALQLVWQLPTLFRVGYRFRLRLAFRDPKLIKVMQLFGPGAVIASTVQVNVLINTIFASIGEGWVAWINQSFRILHLPIGLVGVAVSVATLPALSRAAAKGDDDAFRRTFSHAIRLVILFTVPATVGLLVLSSPIVRLVFEQGAFGPDDTVAVAAALRYYAIGLLSFAGVKIVTDGFYALQDIHAPVAVSLLGTVSNALLNWIFVVVIGMDHRGLALATSITMILSLVSLAILFRRRSPVGRLDGRRTLFMFAKTLVASAVMGVAAYYTFLTFDEAFGHDRVWARLLEVGGAIAVALGVYFVGCRLLRIEELDEALQAIFPGRKWR